MDRSRFARPVERIAACPICDRTPRLQIASAEDVFLEMGLRRRFFLERLRGPLDISELRDVTEMAHCRPAAILWCEGCDVLVRREIVDPLAVYLDDHYTPRSLARIHDAHVEEFRARRWLRDLLPRDARVLEIGSYAAGFLSVASEWGYDVTGFDVNADAVDFGRSLGFDVRQELPAGRFDAVCIWNCFEQMRDPAEFLNLAPLTVIRTPDARVYRDCRDVKTLAYNNLLGFPHRLGFTESSLRRFGFQTVRRTRAMRPQRERMHGWARDEEREIPGAWLEAVLRGPRAEGRRA